MSHVSRSLPFNKLGHIVALAAMLVALLIAGAGTAQANGFLYSTTTEGFEKSGGVSFYGHGYGKLEYWHTPLLQNKARTGQGNAYLSPGAGTWSGFQKVIGAQANGGCFGEVWVSPLGAKLIEVDVTDHSNGQRLYGFPKQVQTQINGASTYYQRVKFNFNLPWKAVDVMVKVVNVSGGGSVQAARFDDLKVDCWVIG
jgi:hypothetical protein